MFDIDGVCTTGLYGTVEELRNRLAWADVIEAESVQAQLEVEVDNHRNNIGPKLHGQLHAQQARMRIPAHALLHFLSLQGQLSPPSQIKIKG